MVDTIDDLPVCSGKREGVIAYVKDEKTTYICEEGKWFADEEDSLSLSSAATEEESSSSVVSSSAEESSSSVNSSDSGWSRDVPKESFLNPEIEYGEMTNARDGKKYKTVEICNEDKSLCQTWMAENLNYSVNAGTQSWCGGGSGDEEGDCSEYGRLYTWAAAIDSVALANDADDPLTCGYDVECTLPATVQGICPSGWHLPDYEEWEALITAVGGKDKAGKALKSQTGWTSFGNLSAFTDDYGFSALPAGRKYCGSSFKSVDDEAYFWSASLYKESKKWNAYYMSLRYSLFSANLDDESKDNGYSVRCLKD